MKIYKLVIDTNGKTTANNIVQRLSDNAFIPFDPANTDYANFKRQINEETAQLEDANGNLMSAQQAKAYVATLP